MKSRDQLLLEEAYQEIIDSSEVPIDPRYEYKYFRGVTDEELEKIKELGHLLPSLDLIPNDNEVLEQVFGEDYYSMSERQVTRALKGMIPWFTGNLKSLQGGVNLTKDFDNAKGYGEFVVAVKIPSHEVADLDKVYAIAKDSSNVKVGAVYDVSARKWI